jgi:hypothetical protein
MSESRQSRRFSDPRAMSAFHLIATKSQTHETSYTAAPPFQGPPVSPKRADAERRHRTSRPEAPVTSGDPRDPANPAGTPLLQLRRRAGDYRRRRVDAQRRLATYGARVGEAFAFAAELELKRAGLAEIEADLAKDGAVDDLAENAKESPADGRRAAA